MTLHALAGLLALNVVFLVSGLALLWVLRGLETWSAVARLGGVAYLMGVAAVGSTWTLLLIAGLRLSVGVLVVAVPVGILVACLLVGRRRGRRRPRPDPVSREALIVTALALAAVGVFLEAAFRGARLTALNSWDAWAFWVPKAEVIYFLGGLDPQFFTLLPGSSYPPLVPVLDAAAFRFMGSPGRCQPPRAVLVLRGRLPLGHCGPPRGPRPAWILWPVLLLRSRRRGSAIRLEVHRGRSLSRVPVRAAVLLVFLWLRDRRPWMLVAATLLMCGAVLAKREGLLLIAVLVVAALLAGAREIRAIWRPLALRLSSWAPWRSRGGSGTSPMVSPARRPRAASFRVRTPDGSGRRCASRLGVLFDNGYWSSSRRWRSARWFSPRWRERRTSVVFFGSLVALVTLGGAWITWAIPELEITEELGGKPDRPLHGCSCPALRGRRAAASRRRLVVVRQRAERGSFEMVAPGARGNRRGRRRSAARVPARVLAADGAPRFPTRSECVKTATADAPGLDVVYGRFDDPRAARERLRAITRVGFVGAAVELDACGRWKVSYDSIDSLGAG